jgi:hypothetical protein
MKRIVIESQCLSIRGKGNVLGVISYLIRSVMCSWNENVFIILLRQVCLVIFDDQVEGGNVDTDSNVCLKHAYIKIVFISYYIFFRWFQNEMISRLSLLNTSPERNTSRLFVFIRLLG